MKSIKLLLVCFLCFGNTYAQEAENNGHSVVVEIIKKRDKVSSVVEIKGFQASDSSFIKSIKNNINQAIQDIKKIKKGKYIVIAKFILSRDGSLSDINCENDPGFDICKSIIRVLKKSKKWIPVQRL